MTAHLIPLLFALAAPAAAHVALWHPSMYGYVHSHPYPH